MVQIQPQWFKNCLEVIPVQEGIRAVRFTEQQLQYYSSTEALRTRSSCSSGTMLDIITDSEYIELHYSVGGQARGWLYFDIYINDNYVQSIGSDQVMEKEGRLRFELSGYEKSRRVTIYLPHLVELTLLNIQVSPGASIDPVPKETQNLLCLGDSITQGMDAKYPSSAYPALLSRFLGMNVLNHGVGGFVFDKASLDSKLPYEPDLITVAYGTNDWNRYASLSEFSHHCEAYMAELTAMYPAAEIAVITPIWRADRNELRAMGSFSELSSKIAEICSGYRNLRLINGMNLVPHQQRFFGDGKLHPNDEGFLHMALGILKHLRNS